MISKYFNHLSFNTYEKKFLRKKNSFKKKSPSKKKILFQCPMSYHFLLASKSLILEEHNQSKIYGTFPNIIKPLKKENIFYQILHFIFNEIFFCLLRLKWKKLYKKIHITNFKSFINYNFKNIYCSYAQTLKIMKKIKNKDDVNKIKIKKINIGDLIYDTYIRYRGIPTIDINDFFLKYILFRTFLLIFSLEKFLLTNKIKIYYTSYSSYINHGLLVRFFLSRGIKVISLPRHYGNNYANKLTKNNPYARKNYKELLSKFNKYQNKEKKIRLAKKKFIQRFTKKGDKLTEYLTYKANYIKGKKNNIINYNGIVFLHDFYDAPHEGGLQIFSDYFEWFDFLYNLIKKNNLNFAFKFHPNSKPESLRFNDFLINNYKCKFINQNFSNFDIFKSKNFKVGISAKGSVLQELLFLKKTPIYLAENMISPLNIHKIPKNKNEYASLILNYKKIKINNYHIKNFMKLYYMAITDQSYLKCEIAKKVNLKDMSDRNLKDLLTYNNKIDLYYNMNKKLFENKQI